MDAIINDRTCSAADLFMLKIVKKLKHETKRSHFPKDVIIYANKNMWCIMRGPR